jgi:hypothetical protein
LFSDQSIRRVTAEVLSKANRAKSHEDLCVALAGSSEMSKRLEPASLAPLPAFTGFADAAMHAMRRLWREVNHDGAKQAPPIEKVARAPDLRSSLDQLRKAGDTWLRTPGRSRFPREDVVTRLAETMRRATSPLVQLRALASHHQVYGGGRRWFREQSGKLVPLVADTGIAASDYRFRLQPLCRLASQCGVANMNSALDVVAQQGPDDEDGETE